MVQNLLASSRLQGKTRSFTILEVAMAGEDDHVDSVRSWSGAVWSDWAEYHSAIADLIDDAEVI